MGNVKEFEVDKTQAILQEIEGERLHQEAKWGQQNHDPVFYLAILAEEFGEASKCVVDAEMAKISSYPGIQHNELRHLRTELVQPAAVAVAMIESLDRNELKELRETIELMQEKSSV